MKYKIFLFLFLAVFLLNGINATTSCSSSTFSTIYETTSIPTSEITISNCQNNNANSSVSISLTGQGTSYISLGSDSSVLGSSSQKDLKILINSAIPVGNYLLSMSFSDSSQSIPISITINSPPTQSSGILVFPTSKVVTVQQGSEKSQSITITVPSTYPNSITIQSVDFNPGTETILFGDLNLGLISPGQTVSIPIIFSGRDAQVGVYSTGLSIFAINNSGQIPLPTVNLQLQVTQGITVLTNNSFSSAPSCALSPTIMNLNQTATLTCSGVFQNLKVIPEFDDEYFVGINVQPPSGSSSIYTYNLRPVKFGTTTFLARFSFDGSRIFSPFKQEVKINPSGTNTAGGTTIKLEYYQNDVKKSVGSLATGTLRILAVDNLTNSAIPPEKVTYLLNGQYVNNTFQINLGSNYELRVSATELGYLDTIVNLTVSEITIPFTLSPSKETYNVGETIDITSSIENVSYLINGVIVLGFPYTLSSAGDYTVTAQKIGYTDTIQNFSVIEGIFITAGDQEYKKGDTAILDLNKASNWSVSFNGNSSYALGDGSRISFEIEEAGTYDIYANGNLVKSVVIEDKGFWGSLPGWGKGVIIVFGIGILFFVGANYWKNKSSDDDVDDIVGAG